MAGSSFGSLFRITTFGESHGKGLGVIIDGCPAGVNLSEQEIQKEMDRRKPGQNLRASQRRETDKVRILSGVFEGKSTGTPIAIVLFNEDQHSGDYHELQHVFRPGHADFPFFEKYGIRDYRGGGRSSGRETAARVAAGAVAKQVLSALHINVSARCIELAGITLDSEENRERAEEKILRLRKEEDSAGGVVECQVTGLPPGIGETVFEKLDARLGQAILSIGSVKAVSFGDGEEAARSRGSENNDAFTVTEGRIVTKTNHAGGVLGGMSTGMPLILRAYCKPTPSIAREQETVDEEGCPVSLRIGGRHDPTVAERATVVVECMAAVTVLDLLLQNTVAKLSNLQKIYNTEE